MVSRWRSRLIIVGALYLLSGVLLPAQQTAQRSKGIPVRSSPADYPAHISIAGNTYAATLLSGDETKHLFAFDISKSYVVFEVAVYPESGARVTIDPGNFVVKTPQSGDFVHPATSETVAAAIQQKNLPNRHVGEGSITAETEVGYESGRDPVTGQPVHGTYTASRVGVTRGGDHGPPPFPSPGGSPQDRELLENQLWEKSLPEGEYSRPTAGYLYFPSSLLKKKGSESYELRYMDPAASSSEKVQLRIPAKSRR